MALQRDERPGVEPTLASPRIEDNATARRTKRSATTSELPSSFDGLPTVSREHYSIEGEVGRGGQGRVLRAQDHRLRRTVALKESLHDDPGSLARFAREAFITARLEHPSIVPVHEAGRWTSGEPFYAMKSVSGRALDTLISEAKSLDERMALLPNVARVAEAIAYAHSRHIIHRDLKPSNVLIGEFGETVVIDWGLAKELGGSPLAEPGPDASRSDAPSDATLAGDIVGTPAYMPPEQARGEEVDERVDVYALGAMLYELASGSPPYALRKGRDRSVLRGPPDPLEQLEPRVPRDLLAVIEKAMARDPAGRYASAGELADELRKFLAGRLVGAHRYSPWQLVKRWASRYRAVLTASGLLLAILVVFAVVSVARIVHERDLANRARIATEAAEKEASERSRALVLLQARAQLDRDPTASLAWLKTYPPSAPNWKTVSEIASDAWTRGVAEHVWRGEQPFASVAFTTDGRKVVAGSRERLLRVWDVETGTVRRLESDILLGGSVVVSSDGKWIASSDGVRAIRVWDVATGARRAFDDVDAARLEFSSDGALLLASGALAGGTVLTVATGARLPISVATRPLVNATFLPGEHTIAAVDADALMLIDAATAVRTQVGPLGAKPSYVVVSPDKRWIVVGTPENSILVFERRTAKRRELKTTMFLAGRLRFSGDGAMVTWGTVHGLIRWDLDRGEAHDADYPDMCQAVEPATDGTFLISGQQNGLVAWDPVAGKGRALLGHSATVTSIAVSPDGKWAATASADRTVRLWRLGGGERVLRNLYGADLSPDGRTILGLRSNDRAACTVRHRVGHGDDAQRTAYLGVGVERSVCAGQSERDHQRWRARPRPRGSRVGSASPCPAVRRGDGARSKRSVFTRWEERGHRDEHGSRRASGPGVWLFAHAGKTRGKGAGRRLRAGRSNDRVGGARQRRETVEHRDR